VHTVREGKNYIVKRVEVRQEDEGVTCFTNLCSFKRTEESFLKVQVPKFMEQKWAKLLGGYTADTLPLNNDYGNLR
jgi:hypothetical protein